MGMFGLALSNRTTKDSDIGILHAGSYHPAKQIQICIQISCIVDILSWSSKNDVTDCCSHASQPHVAVVAVFLGWPNLCMLLSKLVSVFFFSLLLWSQRVPCYMLFNVFRCKYKHLGNKYPAQFFLHFYTEQHQCKNDCCWLHTTHVLWSDLKKLLIFFTSLCLWGQLQCLE